MTKILVTGGNGLVGSALKRISRDDLVFISREDVDLTDFVATRELFREIKPEKVIHLAAAVGGLGGNLVHSGEYFRNNINIILDRLNGNHSSWRTFF